MKAAIAAALALGAHAVIGMEWEQNLSPPEPGQFPALRPLTAKYQFGWSAFTAAESDFVFSKPNAGVLRLDVKAKTTGFVRTLWKLDAQHTAVTTAATLRPVSVEQTEVYKKVTRRTRLTFDADGVTRLRSSTPAGSQRAKPKRFDFPNLFDIHSALLWVRSQSLQPGDIYRFVVYPATAAYFAEVTVLGRQKIEVPGRSGDAFKLELKLRRIDKNRALLPHEKFKRAYAWLSDDGDRLLLKAQAEIAVGSVWSELEKVEFGKQDPR
jgi:hypothetical protein